jgi:hypothetical protein
MVHNPLALCVTKGSLGSIVTRQTPGGCYQVEVAVQSAREEGSGSEMACSLSLSAPTPVRQPHESSSFERASQEIERASQELPPVRQPGALTEAPLPPDADATVLILASHQAPEQQQQQPGEARDAARTSRAVLAPLQAGGPEVPCCTGARGRPGSGVVGVNVEPVQAGGSQTDPESCQAGVPPQQCENQPVMAGAVEGTLDEVLAVHAASGVEQTAEEPQQAARADTVFDGEASDDDWDAALVQLLDGSSCAATQQPPPPPHLQPDGRPGIIGPVDSCVRWQPPDLDMVAGPSGRGADEAVAARSAAGRRGHGVQQRLCPPVRPPSVSTASPCQCADAYASFALCL